MKIDAGLMGSLEDVPRRVKELEAQGFDGLVTAELGNRSGMSTIPVVL